MKRHLQFALASAVAVVAGFGLASCSVDSSFPYKPEAFTTPDPKTELAPRATVTNFVGTTNTKIAYALEISGIRTIHYIDYNDSVPKAVKLLKPADRLEYHADSPLLSPDGKFVTYFLTSAGEIEAYVQKLDPTAAPVKIAAPATDPHWWQDASSNLFLIYSDGGGFIDDVNALTGKATFKQQVNATDPTQKIGAPTTLVDKAYNGGLSKDGKYLCTGYKLTYFYDLIGGQPIPVNTQKQTCNPSISPSTTVTDQMMFLCWDGIQAITGYDPTKSLTQHQVIFIVDKSNTLVKAFDMNEMFTGSDQKNQFQDPEWSNNPDFFTALASKKDDANHWDAYIVKISTGTSVAFNKPTMSFNETSTPYIWIGQ